MVPGDAHGPPCPWADRRGTLRAVTSDPLLDPVPPTHDALPSPSLRRNRAFVLVWSAATVSVFGSFVTRIALPFVAILTLGAGPIEVAVLRSLELVAALVVGLVAGAWVDRLRRRPVLIWADIGRAALLGSIPLAALGGWLTLPQVFIVAAAAAVLTTFFDVADRAYLPTIVPRTDLVRANGALAATSSAVEFAAFGVAGFLVNILTAPIVMGSCPVSSEFRTLYAFHPSVRATASISRRSVSAFLISSLLTFSTGCIVAKPALSPLFSTATTTLVLPSAPRPLLPGLEEPK